MQPSNIEQQALRAGTAQMTSEFSAAERLFPEQIVRAYDSREIWNARTAVEAEIRKLVELVGKPIGVRHLEDPFTSVCSADCSGRFISWIVWRTLREIDHNLGKTDLIPFVPIQRKAATNAVQSETRAQRFAGNVPLFVTEYYESGQDLLWLARALKRDPSSICVATDVWNTRDHFNLPAPIVFRIASSHLSESFYLDGAVINGIVQSGDSSVRRVRMRPIDGINEIVNPAAWARYVAFGQIGPMVRELLRTCSS